MKKYVATMLSFGNSCNYRNHRCNQRYALLGWRLGTCSTDSSNTRFCTLSPTFSFSFFSAIISYHQPFCLDSSFSKDQNQKLNYLLPTKPHLVFRHIFKPLPLHSPAVPFFAKNLRVDIKKR